MQNEKKPGRSERRVVSYDELETIYQQQPDKPQQTPKPIKTGFSYETFPRCFLAEGSVHPQGSVQ